jgi:pimeloyl-ACP methyl ester carboxylesterase
LEAITNCVIKVRKQWVLQVPISVCLLLSAPAIAIDKLGLRQYTLTRFDGSDIHYYLGRRGITKPQSLLVIIQGSDCNSVMNNPRIKEIAAVAPAAAVLLVEKYALTADLPFSKETARSDCPDTYMRNNVPEQRVMDYARIVAALRISAASWWNRKLIIVGGSEGAQIAEQVAAIVPETDCLIVFGFGGRHFEDDVLQSIRDEMKEAGLDDKATAEKVVAMQEMFKAALKDRSPDEIASGYSHAWWASMLRMDQSAMLRAVSVPVLAIQGGRDHNVSIAGARALMSPFRAGGKGNVEYIEYPGLDHAFTDADGTSHWDRVIHDISVWLNQQSSAHP